MKRERSVSEDTKMFKKKKKKKGKKSKHEKGGVNKIVLCP